MSGAYYTAVFLAGAVFSVTIYLLRSQLLQPSKWFGTLWLCIYVSSILLSAVFQTSTFRYGLSSIVLLAFLCYLALKQPFQSKGMNILHSVWTFLCFLSAGGCWVLARRFQFPPHGSHAVIAVMLTGFGVAGALYSLYPFLDEDIMALTAAISVPKPSSGARSGSSGVSSGSSGGGGDSGGRRMVQERPTLRRTYTNTSNQSISHRA